MGEAKRRGSFEARKQASINKKEETYRVLGLPSDALELASFIGMIFDRSKKGKEAIEMAVAQFPDLAVKRALWDGLQWQFLIYIKQIKFEGQFSTMAIDKDTLLNEGIPAVMAKILEIGGFCAFALAVEEDLIPEIQAKIAQIQPVLGSDAPPSSKTH